MAEKVAQNSRSELSPSPRPAKMILLKQVPAFNLEFLRFRMIARPLAMTLAPKRAVKWLEQRA